jgi:hypothetical protein
MGPRISPLLYSPKKNMCPDSRLIPLKPTEGLTRISCTHIHSTAACAAFCKESRMKIGEFTKPHRKSGGMGHPTFVAGGVFILIGGRKVHGNPVEKHVPGQSVIPPNVCSWCFQPWSLTWFTHYDKLPPRPLTRALSSPRPLHRHQAYRSTSRHPGRGLPRPSRVQLDARLPRRRG